MDNDNIVTFGQIKGGKPDDTTDDRLPEHDYCLINHDGDEFPATGFLIFTPHHIAVMRDNGKGAIPVLVMPLSELKAAALDEDEIVD